MPHNSIIWVWLKMGVGGFVALLYFVGMALLVGVRALLRMPRDEMSAIALVATLYVMMHFIYAYADISWDAQSMLYMGMMMGILASLERIVAQPVFPPPKRWPWQPDPAPPAGLLPIPDEVERG
jgi:O-antigen ligase